jgi:hypothetical protein
MSKQTNTGSSSKKITTNLAKISAVMESQSNLHPASKAPTFMPLKAPGPKSNYLDWVFVLWVHFRSCDVIYVLDPVKQVVQTPEWRRNNLAVVLVLTSTVDPCNLWFICDHKEDAAGMWAALRAAHQDSSTGGRMYWLHKLVLSRMSRDNVESHIDKMAGYAVVFHSRSNAKEVHFIYYKFTYRMYTRTGCKRRNIREEYRRNPEEYTIHQHHRINNKEELHQKQAGYTNNGSSTRSGNRGKKDQEEERPRP